MAKKKIAEGEVVRTHYYRLFSDGLVRRVEFMSDGSIRQTLNEVVWLADRQRAYQWGRPYPQTQQEIDRLTRWKQWEQIQEPNF